MGRLDALETLLDETEVLLREMDDLTVSEALESGRPPDWSLAAEQDCCAWCGHAFHGLACHPPPQFVAGFDPTPDTLFEPSALSQATAHLSTVELRPWNCRCDSSLVRRDDTWRAHPFSLSRQRNIVDEFGLDGWAARALDQDRRLLGRFKNDYSPGQTGQVYHGANGAIWTTWRDAGRLRFSVDVATVSALETFLVGAEPAPAPAPAPSVSEAIQRARASRGSGPERPPAGRMKRPREHGI